MGAEGRLQRAEDRADRAARQSDPRDPSGAAIEKDLGLRRPDSIIDFYLEFLGEPVLYPVQSLLLKLIFLEVEHLTEYDHRRLTKFGAGFVPGVGEDGRPSFVGTHGLPPDVLTRLSHCRHTGYTWFPEVLMVIGRRGSKGHLGAVVAARVIWELMLMVDPHAELKIAAGKRLTIPVFAGQADQARANQFRDIAEMITRAPCFEPFVARQTASRLLLWTPHQILNGEDTNPEKALIEVVAREATPLSARGPATPMVLFDEMAHMNAAGANRSAGEVFNAALPALAQFDFAMLYEASSPWDKTGQFYANCCEALLLDEDGRSLCPDALFVQLPTWAMYEDWELTHDPDFVTYPGGPPFPRIDKPYLTRTSPVLRRAEARDPVSFATEFGAQWAAVQNPFLDERHVRLVFDALPDRRFYMHERGSLDRDYHAHIDLSRRHANTAFVIGHTEVLDGHRHLIIDLIRVWHPGDYDDGEIDQYRVADEVLEYVKAFRLVQVTVDSYDAPLITQHLGRLVTQHQLSWRPRLTEVPASAARNRSEARLFREAIGLERVHSPEHDEARRELLFLQEGADGKVGPPTTGLVTTSDIADCFFALTSKLLDGHLETIESLATLQPRFRPSFEPSTPEAAAVFNDLGVGFAGNRRAQLRRGRGTNPARGHPY